jgi:nucleoside-diphosphate-sugar epimerase
MSKILVTGATGLIGSFLTEELAKGNEVKCLALKGTDTKVLDGLGVEIVYGDITDIESLKPVVKEFDTVFHLAAAFKKDLPSNANKEVYFKINVRGTENLLEVCKQNGVGKVVHFSASGVYGHSSDKPINETAPYRPTNPYEESKVEGEKVALRYNEAGLPVTIIQPTIVYGPRETIAFMRMFKGIKNGTFKMVGNGKNELHLVYVKNLVDGIILASKHKHAGGQKYLIGDDRAYPVLEIVQTIADAVGVPAPKMKIPYRAAWLAAIPFEILGKITRKRPFLSRYTVNFLSKNRVYDISKAKNELGYSSSVNLKDGVKVTAEWYINNGLL